MTADLAPLLNPAIGYLQLEMADEAIEEIENLPAACRLLPQVVRLRAEIYCHAGAWEALRQMALELVADLPEDSQNWIWLAYATRRCRSIAEAEQVLLQALRHHAREPMIHFNLACYAAQTGHLETRICSRCGRSCKPPESEISLQIQRDAGGFADFLHVLRRVFLFAIKRPHRARPRRIAGGTADDVDVHLPHDVADAGDVEFFRRKVGLDELGNFPHRGQHFDVTRLVELMQVLHPLDLRHEDEPRKERVVLQQQPAVRDATEDETAVFQLGIQCKSHVSRKPSSPVLVTSRFRV
jgi:hypothetical protein